MRRRELMLLPGSMMTAAGALRAQQAMPVVGFLSSRSPGEAATVVTAFHQGLAETGYVEGQNLAIEYRWAEGPFDPDRQTRRVFVSALARARAGVAKRTIASPSYEVDGPKFGPKRSDIG